MPFLLIFRSDQALFEPTQFVQFLISTHKATQIRESGMEGAFVCADFGCGADSVIVELKTGRRSVVISDSGPAALTFAFLFQQYTPVPLQMVDEAYTFELRLADFGSPEQIGDAIKMASLKESG